MSRKILIGCIVAVSASVLLVVCVLSVGPTTNEGRYRELHRLGSRYKAAWTGKPWFRERVAAVLHFTTLTNYYRGRLEADSNALLKSGYFVETSVGVPNLKARIPQVRSILSKTASNTGAYYEAKLYWPSNEVRLVCRKADVALWQEAFRKVHE